MHVIGEETSERLDVIPAQYRVIVTHRPRLACRACERIVEAPAPEHLIKSGLPTEAMVASVLVAKYGWHLPLYRQAKMLAAQGLDLDRSTLAFWVGYAAAELMPLYERLKANLLASAKLAVDETPVPVLDPGRGQTKTGYFWAIARDDRPWGGTDPPAVVYTYAPGRGGEHLEQAARKLSRHRAVRRLCPLQEAAGGQDHRRLLLEPPAARVLQDRRARRCAYRHRSRGAHCADLRHREGRARRKCRCAPCRAPGKIAPARRRPQDLLRASAHASLGRLGDAKIIRYGLRHWDGLTRFLDDGRIELDTNIVERSMRPQVTHEVIVQLLFKCLQTLEVCFCQKRDTGYPFGQSQLSLHLSPDQTRGFGRARPAQPAWREGYSL